MKFEFVSFLPGGSYKTSDDVPEVFTRLVQTEHYVLQADTSEAGSVFALWAAVVVRFDSVFWAEGRIGDYLFPDVLDLGSAKYSFTYGSALAYLKWWKDRVVLFETWERYLVDAPLGVAMNVPHGNALISSLNWLVASANCQPAGLNYEVTDLDKKDGEEDLKDVKRASESDVRAIQASQALGQGRLSIESLNRALNLDGGPVLVDGNPVVQGDGFLNTHRAYLNAFRRCLAPYAGSCPALNKRFLEASDAQLGVQLSDLYNGFMRSSFPDVYAAQRAVEEIKAAEARRERESKKR